MKLQNHSSREAANDVLRNEGYLWNERRERWDRPGTYNKAKVVHNQLTENFRIYFYQDA